MNRESLVSRKIMKALRKIPNSVWTRQELRTNVRGESDIIGCVRGLSFRIETKTDKFNIEKPEEREVLQIYKLGKHAQAGGASFIMTESNWAYHVARIAKFAAGTLLIVATLACSNRRDEPSERLEARRAEIQQLYQQVTEYRKRNNLPGDAPWGFSAHCLPGEICLRSNSYRDNCLCVQFKKEEIPQ